MTQMSLGIDVAETAAGDSGVDAGGQPPPSVGILDRLRGAVDICSVPAGERGVGAWMDVLTEVTQAMTVLAAARDAAVVRLAAIDEVVDEDGVVRDKVNGLGTVSLDAGAMVSIATGTSTRFGAEMVDQAVTRVVRVPALHEAMLEGVLDEYKARCIADELADVPHDLARTVVDAISGELSAKSGPALRRRTREVLFALCPELLKERIRTARKGVGLRRWVGEPGTDSWGGSFPSERAAVAWAAIDALARQYRQEGRYDTLEHARAYALMDLVDGNTTVETVLHLTVPAGSVDAGSGDANGAETDESVSDSATSSQNPAAATSGQDRPGLTVGSAGERFVGASGPMGSELSWFPLTSLATATFAPATGARRCDPDTGALLDVGDRLGTTSYRPGVVLQAFVRRRDGGCRFPGCSVAARQCDLDHVVPWPRGSTTTTNLICLCRRHHRVKQRRRWRVRFRHDGTVEWTDPRGTVLLTEPVDHLGATQTRTVEVPPASEGPSALIEPSAGELRSMAEQVMAIALEHLLKAGSAGTSVGRANPTRSVGAITTEEIGDLARQVRSGRFATIDEAVEARETALRRECAEDLDDPAGHRSCRVDFRFVRVDDDGGHDVADDVGHDIADDIASDDGRDAGRASVHPVVVIDRDERPCSAVNRVAAGAAEPPPF